jgi:uncharacterized RDD family membrane protein YckC
MTQLGETPDHSPASGGSGAPATEPAQALPSPYLAAGESVPEAYLAPPQPGMPSFGSSKPADSGPLAWRPGQQNGPGQRNGYQSYGQTSQQPVSQRPYGRPGAGGRPVLGPGQRAQRDPALAAGWERLLAAMLDWLAILAVAVLAFSAPLLRIWRQLEAIADRYPSFNSPGAQAAVDRFARSPATLDTLLHFWLAVFAIALVYYWVMHALWGATLGKKALGVAVVMAKDRARVGVQPAGIRAVAFLAGPAILLLAPHIEILGGIMWLSDNGTLLLDPRGQCLHDKLAGTQVIRKRWLRQQAQQQTRPW